MTPLGSKIDPRTTPRRQKVLQNDILTQTPKELETNIQNGGLKALKVGSAAPPGNEVNAISYVLRTFVRHH